MGGINWNKYYLLMKKFLLFFIVLFVYSCFNRSISDEDFEIFLTNDDFTDTASYTTSLGIIYFENGICKCPEAAPGYTEVINDIEYKVVDNASIVTQLSNGNFNLCTTAVTEMNTLFQSNINFNYDISFWDTSNVTNMVQMFHGARAFNQDIGIWDTSKVISIEAMF